MCGRGPVSASEADEVASFFAVVFAAETDGNVWWRPGRISTRDWRMSPTSAVPKIATGTWRKRGD